MTRLAVLASGSGTILASMVEREANKDSDRGNVCSVYYNRLASNTPLGVDATLLYYLGRLTPEPTYPELQLNVPWLAPVTSIAPSESPLASTSLPRRPGPGIASEGAGSGARGCRSQPLRR